MDKTLLNKTVNKDKVWSLDIKNKASFLRDNHYLKIDHGFRNEILNLINNLNYTKWLRTHSNQNSVLTGLNKDKKKIEKIEHDVASVENNKLIFKNKSNTTMRQLWDCGFISEFSDLIYRPPIVDNIHLKKIIHNKYINDIISAYFKDDYCIHSIKFFHNEYQKLHPKQKWHIDDYLNPGTFLKLFIPLCDFKGEENGSTCVIRNTALGGNLPDPFPPKTYRINDDYIYEFYDKKDIIPLVSKLGSVFLARTDGYHKGGFIKIPNNTRTVAIIEYRLLKNHLSYLDFHIKHYYIKKGCKCKKCRK